MLIVLTYTIGIIVGFLAGYFLNKEKAKEAISTIQSSYHNRFKDPVRYGAIKVPTAEDLRKRGTAQEEEEKAMEESLDSIFTKP